MSDKKTQINKALKDQPDDQENKGPFIWVSCPKPRRRAGYRFGPEAVKVFEKDLDKEKMIALESDTLLVIRPGEE